MNATQIKLDSYQCEDCGEFSHHEQAISTAPHGKPAFCPYCGSKNIEWRDDELYKLVENSAYCFISWAGPND